MLGCAFAGRCSILLSASTSPSNRHPLLEIKGSWTVGDALCFLAFPNAPFSICRGSGWKVSLNSLSTRGFVLGCGTGRIELTSNGSSFDQDRELAREIPADGLRQEPSSMGPRRCASYLHQQYARLLPEQVGECLQDESDEVSRENPISCSSLPFSPSFLSSRTVQLTHSSSLLRYGSLCSSFP